MGPSTRVDLDADSAGFGISRRVSDMISEWRFRLPELAGPGAPDDASRPLRVARVLGDGEGRGWLHVCPEGACGVPERWLVVTPPPRGEEALGCSFRWVVLPGRFRLEAVRGVRLYGVQGPPARQMLHVLELYEPGGGMP